MMRIATRHIARAVWVPSLAALAVLVMLDGLINLVGELDDLGRGSYTLATALMALGFELPASAYALYPMALLLGGLMGLGALAKNAELVALGAAGMSRRVIGTAALAGGVLASLVAVPVGEWVAPHAHVLASELRAGHLADAGLLQSRHGFWLRDGRDFVNIRQVFPGPELRDLYLYDFDDAGRLTRALHAARARHQGSRWMLYDVAESRIAPERVTTHHSAQMPWNSTLAPRQLEALALKPEQLALSALRDQIRYLQANRLDARRLQLAFWQRLLRPVTALAMLAIAIPFAFGPLRHAGAGLRIVVGLLCGVGYYIVYQTTSQFGLVFGLSPQVSALLPFLPLIVAYFAVRRAN